MLYFFLYYSVLFLSTDMMKIAPKGNERIRRILTAYVDNIIQTGHIPVPFLLLTWPSGLWKISVAEELSKQLLGEFSLNDTLALYDYSREIEKSHSIKISSDEKITLPDGTIYQDLGIRETHEWIVKSPAGKYKCLVIEDIERLTESAANALLKIFEEPLPGRLIIATTSQPMDVLPTILSRALLFSFYPVSDEVMDAYITEESFLQWFDRGFLYAVASGRVGILQDLVENQEAMKSLQKWYTALVHSYPIGLQNIAGWPDSTADKTHMPKKTPFEVYKDLLPVIAGWYEKVLLQAYIYYAAKQQARDYVALAQETSSLCSFAIKNDHIFYDFVLRLDALTRT